MRVLFDNGTPRGVADALSGHAVEEARLHGWDNLRNGELLDAAEAVQFDVFLTTDRNIRYQPAQRSTAASPKLRFPRTELPQYGRCLRSVRSVISRDTRGG